MFELIKWTDVVRVPGQAPAAAARVGEPGE